MRLYLAKLENHYEYRRNAGQASGPLAVTFDYDQLVAASETLMPRLPFKRGVFRFRTHDEANQWMTRQILAGALKKARARRSERT